jgi:hypothetical protein
MVNIKHDLLFMIKGREKAKCWERGQPELLVWSKQKQGTKNIKKGSKNRKEKGGDERNKVYSSSPKKPHEEVENSQDN